MLPDAVPDREPETWPGSSEVVVPGSGSSGSSESGLDPAYEYVARLAVIDAQAAEDALAPSTREAYRRAWEVFEGWAANNSLMALPATASTVRAFVAHLRDRPVPASLPTINQHLSAIWARHADLGLPSARQDGQLRLRLQGYARQDQERLVRQMSALMVRDVQRIVSVMDEDLQQARRELDDERAVRKTQLLCARDKGVILVGLATAMRRSELARLEVADLREDVEGLVITPRWTKRDQAGTERNPRAVPRGAARATCPVSAVQHWLSLAGIDAGPLFRPVTRWGTVGPRGFTPQVIRTIVQQRAEAAGLPGTWGAHSLRAGFATQSAKNGVARHVIMADGDWRSAAVDRYMRRGALWDGAAAKSLGL
ncbi:tyrosine-type recombinase/integrase [Kineosporia rhizophila]|uniref:tyrosine-type recombinase/integrase n=1 Tax=Kineosporia rhizophila TaxID=84633 RepID=UPI001E2CB4B9|nr:tyrosine-type recombinase/integrase [Kineosporia rhizophila]MCE0539543.1 tyrosine-type recombinase/integrase [Kineosporia rhizophila]